MSKFHICYYYKHVWVRFLKIFIKSSFIIIYLLYNICVFILQECCFETFIVLQIM